REARHEERPAGEDGDQSEGDREDGTAARWIARNDDRGRPDVVGGFGRIGGRWPGRRWGGIGRRGVVGGGDGWLAARHGRCVHCQRRRAGRKPTEVGPSPPGKVLTG